MNADLVIAAALSLGIHLLGLFGWGWMSRSVYRVEAAPTSMEVELVAFRPSSDADPQRAETPRPSEEEGLLPEPVSPSAAAAASYSPPLLSGVRQQASPLEEANVPPRYPRLAVLRGYEGRVRLLVEVDAEGSVSSVHVAEGSGHGVLDRAAVKGVRKWRFRPARLFGVRRASKVEVPVVFRLEENVDR